MNLGSCLPQRYLLVFMSCIAIALLYCVRTSLAIIFEEISLRFNRTEERQNLSYNQLDTCSVQLHDWGGKKQKQILASFYYGYILSRAPGVFLIKRFGCKNSLLLGILLLSLSAILLPYAACSSAGALIALCIFMGIAESIFFPAVTGLTSQWSPRSERTLLFATVLGGVQVGVVISWMLPGFLFEMITWQHLYILLGSVGMIWCFLWGVLCYEHPSSHPFISTEELDYLNKCVPEIDKTMPIPWMAIFKSGPVWALTLANTGFGYGFYTIIFNLPKYYLDISHISHAQNDTIIVMPFLLMWLASVMLGYLSDKIIFVKWTTITQLRRTVAILGAVGPGIGVVCAAYLPDRLSRVALITTVMVSMSMDFCSIGVNAIDLSPNHSYIIMALSNGVASITGILVPAVVNAILSGADRTSSYDNRKRPWQNIFWIMFAVLVITHLPFLMFGSGEIQPWDKSNNIRARPNKNRRRRTSNRREVIESNINRLHTRF